MIFSFDPTMLTSTASSIFGSMSGIVAVIGGITLGFGLVTYMIKIIRDLF